MVEAGVIWGVRVGETVKLGEALKLRVAVGLSVRVALGVGVTLGVRDQGAERLGVGEWLQVSVGVPAPPAQ
jgi:hypothetical protein